MGTRQRDTGLFGRLILGFMRRSNVAGVRMISYPACVALLLLLAGCADFRAYLSCNYLIMQCHPFED